MMFFFYLWMASCIPYTHDDWSWGLQVGLDHLFKADKDSRYVGNFIEVVLTRSEIAKTLFMGVIFTLIPLFATLFVFWLIERKNTGNADLKHLVLFLFSNVLILLIPVDVWRQTNGWIAGFANFVVSGMNLILFFMIIHKVTLGTGFPKHRILWSVCFLIWGIAVQLFIENLSVVHCAIAFVVLLFIWKKKDRRSVMIPLFIGLLIGFALMFTSNIYSSLLKSGYAVGDYRKLMYDPSKPFFVFIGEALSRFFYEFVPQIVFHYGELVGSIAVLMAVLTFMKCQNRMLKYILSVFSAVFGVYYIFTSLESRITGFETIAITNSLFVSLIDCFYVLLIISEIIIVFRERKGLLCWSLFLWLSPFGVLAPMLIINTVGPRSFYTSDICFILFGVAMLGEIIFDTKKVPLIAVSTVLLLGVSVLCIHWVGIYKPISEHYRERKVLIENAVANGQTTIYFPEFPNSQYLWGPDPQRLELKFEWFKEFYHIPSEYDMVFESTEEK